MSIGDRKAKTDYKAHKDRGSASDLNRRGETLNKIAQSLFSDGIICSGGFLTKRRRGGGGITSQTRTYAVITATLQRADPTVSALVEDIDNYEITILNGAYKDEEVDAWVLGYSGSLLEAIPWFQVGDVVEVVKDALFSDTGGREWFIIETVIRVEEAGEDNEDGSPTILSSISWNAEENRAMAVFL